MRWLRRRSAAALEFEFQPRAGSTASGWLLLGIGCAFAADVAWSYLEVEERTQSAMQQLSRAPADPQPQLAARPRYEPKDLEREVAFARNVITKLSLPWNELFKALNETRIEEVQLLGIEPDAEARTLRITAEARDLPAMLTYVGRLEAQGYFRSVGLVQHEVKRDARPPVVSFVVAARWKPQ